MGVWWGGEDGRSRVKVLKRGCGEGGGSYNYIGLGVYDGREG